MVTTSLLVSAGSWLIRRWGAVVGTTKYSEQSHVPNHDSKEKEFELKENSKIQSQDLLLLNRFLNRLRVRAGFAAYRRVRLGISLPAHYDRNGLRLRRDTRERYRSPTSLRMFRAGGLLGMIALLLRLSSILHVIFLGRAFLPTVSISSRMMRAARVLSVEADTAYALTWAVRSSSQSLSCLGVTLL